MSTSLLNFSLKSIADGVSEQYEEGRFESQVEEMVNCVPSLTHGVRRRNPMKGMGNHDVFLNSSDAFFYAFDRGDGHRYAIFMKGDGWALVMELHGLSSMTPIKYFSDSYLHLPAGVKARDGFKAITLGDHTFIVNTTKKIQFNHSKKAPSGGYKDKTFYWIKKTALVVKKQKQQPGATSSDPVETGTLSEGYKYNLNGISVQSRVDSRPGVTPVELGDSYKIAEAFADHSGDSLATHHYNSFAYRLSTPSSWIWSDSFGNQASLGVWYAIDDSSKLPAILPTALDGFIVRVTGGTRSDIDDYYLKYDATLETWKEVPAPGSYVELNENTMPHVLYRMGDTFEFGPYRKVSDDGLSLTGEHQWVERGSGGDNELHDPSFIDKPLVDIFFYKDRLGFLTEDSVVLSQAGEYGNFFPQSIQDMADDDVIDIGVATSNLSLLRKAVPTAGALLIFSDSSQFILDSYQGPLTPGATEVVPISNYTYSSSADATLVGNRVYFSSTIGGYTQLFSYRLMGVNEKLSEASPMMSHLPTYIEGPLLRIVGGSLSGITVFQPRDSKNTLFLLSSVTIGDKDLQNAFYKWTFEGEEISAVQVVQDILYIVFTNGAIGAINLSITGYVTDEPIFYDSYTLPGLEKVPYKSIVLFSQFFVRDQAQKGTKRGHFRLRSLLFTMGDNSRYSIWIGRKGDNLLGDTPQVTTRYYETDERVTVLGGNDTTRVALRSSAEEPFRGFELNTLNIEGFFHQRSRRYGI